MSTRFDGKKKKTRTVVVEEPAGTPFLDTLREHRKGLVAVGAILILLVIGLVLFFTLRGREEDKNWASMHASLEVSTPENQMRDRIRMYQEMFPSDRFASQLNDPLQDLEDLSEVAGSDLKPHVLYQIASRNAEKGNYEAALEVISELESEFQDHPVSSLPSPDSRYSLVGRLKLWCSNELAWRDAHTVEPVEVDTATTALFETDKGSFWIGFYPERSPDHVANFVARAKTGGYNGTSVSSINESYLRLGGEASKDDDPKNDRDEPKGLDPLESERGRYTIPQNLGSLSSASISGGESPTMIDIMLDDTLPLEMDKRQTVFGRVLLDLGPGMSALDTIKNMKTFGTSEDEKYKDNPEYTSIQDAPIEIIRVHRVSIWTGGKIAEGHTWDTSTVVEPGTEPAPPPEEPVAPGDGTEEPSEDK